MQALKSIGREALALFVEDIRFTAALVLWLALMAVLATWVWPTAPLGALVLFAGLALILVENAVHTARRDH